MIETCKTVRVESLDPKTQGDFITINEADFDEKKHTLFEGKEPKGAPPPAPKYSDAVKKKAEELGVNLEEVEGSGANGNVVVKDVEAHAEANKAPEVDFASEEAGELAAELEIELADLQEIQGTGKDGAITVEDLQFFVDEQNDEGDE